VELTSKATPDAGLARTLPTGYLNRTALQFRKHILCDLKGWSTAMLPKKYFFSGHICLTEKQIVGIKDQS
jgi:hypothetical protein